MAPQPAEPRHPSSERYSVTLVPPAVKAITEVMDGTGLSKADVINRAVQVYAYLEARKADGMDVLLRNADGTAERLHIV
ncbi:hypothetical protein ABT354_25270 [Streptomyces sp. NPDC000594]|uniref:hypothetical protein n=1 Tax=Streptomyces sp. NPDC000594 TaxID=3154261 RepID=UPI00331C72CA